MRREPASARDRDVSEHRAGADAVKRFAAGVAAEKDGRFVDATKIFQALVDEDPRFARAWHRLGHVTARRQDPAEAERHIRTALDLEPDNPHYHQSLGAILVQLGRMGEAEAAVRRAIALKPDFAEAYYRLSLFTKPREDDPLIGEIERLLHEGTLGREDRCFLHFAAGKFYDDLADYDRAFAHFERANALSGRQFSVRRYQRYVDDLIEAFPQEIFGARSAAGSASEVPVFVVGMPRSGTSLVEQILASHPRVYGAGELTDIHSITATFPRYAPGRAAYPGCLASVDDEVISGFAEAYLRRVGGLAPEAERIVDKNPMNFEHLGLIALMFPGARIVHCRREPVDTCLSCYFQQFGHRHLHFTYNLAHLGGFYRAYERLMAHWAAVLPADLLEVRYEDVVADTDGAARRLLDFCGLAWDPACAEFHRNPRPVQTSSLWQVRQPIYKRSVARWRHYEAHLGPLFAALEASAKELHAG